MIGVADETQFDSPTQKHQAVFENAFGHRLRVRRVHGVIVGLKEYLSDQGSISGLAAALGPALRFGYGFRWAVCHRDDS